jgi:hypothetical protein
MFDSVAPHEALSVTASNNCYIQPTLNHGSRIWWAFFWPVTLIAGILTVVSNIGMKYTYENMNVPGWALRYPMKYGSYAIEIIVGYFVIYYLLHKNFRRFRIALFPRGAMPTDASAALSLPATFGRSSRVWWTFTWRRLVYSVIAYIVVILPLTWFAALFNPGPVSAGLFFFVVGLIVSGSVSLFVIYSSILDEEFGDFAVRLVFRPSPFGTPVAPAVNLAHSQPSA